LKRKPKLNKLNISFLCQSHDISRDLVGQPWNPLSQYHLPSGKLSHNNGKSPFFIGKLTISMVIFSSYVKLPEGRKMNWGLKSTTHIIFTAMFGLSGLCEGCPKIGYPKLQLLLIIFLAEPVISTYMVY
jgi:hypothetical protein